MKKLEEQQRIKGWLKMIYAEVKQKTRGDKRIQRSPSEKGTGTATIARFQSSLSRLNRNILNYYIRQQRNAPTILVGSNDKQSHKSNLFDLIDSTGSAIKVPQPVRLKDTSDKVEMTLGMDTPMTLTSISNIVETFKEGLLAIIEEDGGCSQSVEQIPTPVTIWPLMRLTPHLHQDSSHHQ
jgi:hypothetical protein